MKVKKEIREYVDQRMVTMRNERSSWYTHWQELAEYFIPRRMRQQLPSPNQKRGQLGLNKKIVDPSGTIASRVCGAGMMSGVTSPARLWFRLKIGKTYSGTDSEVAIWLWEVETRIAFVLQQSNVYNALAGGHWDNVVFGTAPIFLYEDYEDVIRAYPLPVGEFFLAVDDRNFPSTCYREFTLTTKALVDWFGLENCPMDVKKLYENKQYDQEVVVCHSCEPNTQNYVDKRFKFWEVYWVRSAGQEEALRIKGFYEQPFFVLRWDVLGNDAYGTCPGMDALPEVKQLQHETNRKAQAIDKMVTPPLVADIQLRNQPTSMLPGGVTYVSGASKVGVKPIFQVQPPINEMMQDIQEIQNRIKTIFFNDLFMMISQLDTVRSATEINDRREEKMVMLGPVLERLQNEALDPFIDRVFGIMYRGRLFPPPPSSIQGQEIQVQYYSMLAEAQNATKTIGIERTFGFAGTLAAGQPDILDTLDADEAVIEYANALGVSPKVIRDKKTVTFLREQRQQQQQQASILQQTLAGAQAAKTMSQADIGGGQNALSAMAGGGLPQ